MFFLPTLYDSKQPRPQQLQPKQPVLSWCGVLFLTVRGWDFSVLYSNDVYQMKYTSILPCYLEKKTQKNSALPLYKMICASAFKCFEASMVVWVSEDKKLHKMVCDFVCTKCHTSFDCHIMCYVSTDKCSMSKTLTVPNVSDSLVCSSAQPATSPNHEAPTLLVSLHECNVGDCVWVSVRLHA